MSEKTPDIKLPVTCDRTGKTQEVKLPLSNTETFLSNQRARTENAAKVASFFTGLDGPAPDLVVLYKGKLAVLPTVLDKSDQAVLRHLHEATQKDTFPKPTPRKRKEKAPQEESKAAKSPKNHKSSGKSTSETAAAPAE